MSVCAEYQISHSHFLGGPDVWTQDDRDKAIMFQVRQRSTCQNCGTRAEEWDPERGGDRNAYEAGFTHCRGCEVKARAADELDADKEGTQFPRGTAPTLKPRVQVSFDAGGSGSG